MGTNFYAKRIPTTDELKDIKLAIDNRNKEQALNLISEYFTKIHVAKRSAGWKILFDNNNEKYWDVRDSLDSLYKFWNDHPEYEFVDEYEQEYSMEKLEEDIKAFSKGWNAFTAPAENYIFSSPDKEEYRNDKLNYRVSKHTDWS